MRGLQLPRSAPNTLQSPRKNGLTALDAPETPGCHDSSLARVVWAPNRGYIDADYIDIDTLCDNRFTIVQNTGTMSRKRPDPVHCWLVWRKADEAAQDYLYRGLQETGISDTDFRVLCQTRS